MGTENIPYGPVYIAEGPHAGRIGYYDDDGVEFPDDIDWDNVDVNASDTIPSQRVAIVYFGDSFLADGYYLIPDEFIREVTTADLIKRREDLHSQIGRSAAARGAPEIDPEEKIDLLTELHLVESALVDRMIHARYGNEGQGANIFISHSLTDKTFATWLGTDLGKR